MSADLARVREDARSFLTKRHDGAALAAARPAAAPTEVDRFSPFDPADGKRAAELVSSLSRLADEGEDEESGLRAVLSAAEAAERSHGLELTKHALAIFIVHHPAGRKLPFPRLLERQPEMLPEFRAAARRRAALTVDPESALDWFREDPFYNEHHEHWHVVYPWFGFNGSLKDRQGELFLYMHEQMLARYNTERLAAGLGLVQPLDRYTDPIPEAYDSGFPRGRFTPRTANRQLQALNGIPVSDLASWRDRIRDAVQRGVFDNANGGPQPVEADPLGSTVEASIGSVTGTEISGYYGNLHNLAHGFIASVMGPGPYGVMSSTSTAVMDPVFYRWHRHIDDFSFEYQERQPPNGFSDAPDVLIRNGLGGAGSNSPDIILCRADRVPGYNDPGADKDAYGQAEFGEEHWDEEFFGGTSATSELITPFLTSEFTPSEGGQPLTVTYLDQDEFVYFIRVENREQSEQTVTVRIWLAAKNQVEDRRMWIEMDTFEARLPAGARHVIYRPAKFSSVIKKSEGAGIKPPTLISQPGEPNLSADYCDCGWPYNLLLPKGTRQGMQFRLMVMLTANDIDMQGTTHECGSVSLCGTRAERYPDKRPMGYPFCRRFSDGIEAAIAAQSNMAARDLTIRHVDSG